MSTGLRRSGFSGRTSSSGFSMIEALIALLILAVGLLGFALLQTMNLRFTQSAQQRTHATNLAYDLLDQMRANRSQAAWYAGGSGAGFEAGEVDLAEVACQTRPLGSVSLAQSIVRWQCQVVRTLGETANAAVLYNNSTVTVTISWGDQRWDPDNPDAETDFALTTRL
ncbi:type IV pilus modification protein PilV [Luteimonas sp. A501]